MTVLATSTDVGPEEFTFLVSRLLLEKGAWAKDEAGWSGPLQFRFEQQGDGRWDLVMREYPPA